MTSRKTTIQRKTNETSIDLTLDLDGTGESDITTGIGFLDHLKIFPAWFFKICSK